MNDILNEYFLYILFSIYILFERTGILLTTKLPSLIPFCSFLSSEQYHVITTDRKESFKG